MGIEIERKFLVVSSDWQALAPAAPPQQLVQGYLAFGDAQGAPEVRVRLSSPLEGQAGEGKAFLTVKNKGAGQSRDGLVRSEVEDEISVVFARALLSQVQGVAIEKVRHTLPAANGLVIELDVYGGALSGLVVAEVELPSEDAVFEAPAFLGEELTFDKAYKNAALAKNGLPEIASADLKSKPRLR